MYYNNRPKVNFYEQIRAPTKEKTHNTNRRSSVMIERPTEAVPVVGFENYLITKTGEIYSCKTGKYMKNHTDKQGYLYTMLTNEKGQLCHKKNHIAVAEAFLPNLDNLPLVNHLDGNKQNPSVDNLEWDTYSGNTQHAYDNGLIRKNWKPMVRIDPGTMEQVYFRNVTEAVQETKNASQTGISKACNGRSKTHAGFLWKYVEREEEV